MKPTTLGVVSFVGWGDNLLEAADMAAGECNKWLSKHQWRTPDGIGSYTFTTTAAYANDSWRFAITAYGPMEQTPQESYTGQTERLDLDRWR